VIIDIDSHKPLRESVYEQLKMRILKGTLKPGTRLMEVELADDLGVSRTPVREAMRQLEKEGLVEIKPKRGAYVSNISVDDMIDTLIVRKELEGLCAELAAKAINEELSEQLEGIMRQYTQAINNADTEEIIHYDEAFHRCVSEITGNRTLIETYTICQDRTLRFRYLYYEDFKRYESMPAEHKAIADAIESGDAERARRTAEEHAEQLMAFVEKEGADSFR
jgi:DNA-binding GntR family transcriptional regulator